MKFVKRLFIPVLGILLFAACQKEYSVETGGLGGTIGSAQWEFKEGSVQFKGKMDTARIDTASGIAYLTMAGTSDSSNQLISFLVFGTQIKAGSYPSPTVSFKYTDLSSNIIYQNDITAAGGFTLVIIKIDSTGVTGTFSGNVVNATSAAKIITSGKFSATFKKTTTTPVTGTSNCKIASILQYDTTGVGQGPRTVYTYLTASRINKVQLLDSALNVSYNTFDLTFPTSKVQVDTAQYFVTDANGRVTEFHGHINPLNDTTTKIIATYVYNAAGQLTQRKVAPAVAPTVVALQIDYTWTGSNLTKAAGKLLGATGLVNFFDVAYEYDNTKTVKNFISLPAYAFEIDFFQSTVNSGSVPVNPLTKTTERYYDSAGTAVTSTNICSFTRYTIDANNYVQSFITKGDDFEGGLIFGDEKYAFRYKCF